MTEIYNPVDPKAGRTCPHCEANYYEVLFTKMQRNAATGKYTRHWCICCLFCLRDYFWVDDHKQPNGKISGGSEWVFGHGRFEGQTIAEVASTDRGTSYLKVVRQRSKNEDLRERIDEYFRHSRDGFSGEPLTVDSLPQNRDVTRESVKSTGRA